MHDTNPYATPEFTLGDVRAGRAPPQSLSQAIQHGAWVGLKWTTFIVGPVAGLLRLAGPALIVFDVVFHRNWPSPKDTLGILIAPLALYLFCCLWVGVIGAILASVIYLFGRIWPKKGD